MNVASRSVDRAEVEDFLYREAALLDDWDLDAWLALYTDDAHYCIPATDKPDGDPVRDMVIVDDDRERLESRVERLKSRRAHREYPTSRTRHVVANVRLTAAGPDGLDVTANFVVWRFRGPRADQYVGRYDYRLIVADDGLRIRSKRATLDLLTLDAAGAVSTIL